MSTPATMPELIDEAGQIVRLGDKLGQGNEGSIYEVADAPAIVAKIYHRPPAPALAVIV